MWQYVLANSYDLSKIGELTNATSKSLTVGLNRSGNLSFQIPSMDDSADYITAGATCILAIQNGTIRWSGPVWGIEDSLPEEKTTVNCVGWFERLNHRITKTEITTYNTVDIGYIAHDLLNITNADSIAGSTGISPGVLESTFATTYNPLRQYTNIGSQISQMADLENGYDFEVTPDDRKLQIRARQGTETGYLFGYNMGPDNVSKITQSIDASQVANDLIAVGPPGTAFEKYDAGSISLYNGFQEVNALSGDGVNLVTTTAFATAEVFVRKNPRVAITIDPKAGTASPFVEYNVGDTAYVTASRGRIKLNHQKIRIFSFTVTEDPLGNEKVTNILTTASA